MRAEGPVRGKYGSQYRAHGRRSLPASRLYHGHIVTVLRARASALWTENALELTRLGFAASCSPLWGLYGVSASVEGGDVA